MAWTTRRGQGRAGPGVRQAEDEVGEDGRYVQAEGDQDGQPQDLEDSKRGDPLRLAPQPRTCMSCSDKERCSRSDKRRAHDMPCHDMACLMAQHGRQLVFHINGLEQAREHDHLCRQRM